MSDAIKHECGIAFIRLLKPVEYYQKKYNTPFYGLNKLYLLMEKQHNRGQDGAGVANIKLDVQPGNKYISRKRSNSNKPIQDIFEEINERFAVAKTEFPDQFNDANWLKNNLPFTGELFLGHLRYGTFGGNSIENCHPFLRQNNWMTRNLVLAGNFNLTNVDELFALLVELGQHPKEFADTVTVLEKIGHFLDVENEELFKKYKALGYTNAEITHRIIKNLDVAKILKRSAEDWDGGYTMSGLFGHGDAFVLRDPSGIRPAYYYADDEIVVAASERPVIQTAFNLHKHQIKELTPGHALIVKKHGEVSEQMVRPPLERKACSFERIYFSRGSDEDIYNERKALGKAVIPSILQSINHDIENTVFSFIPNTAETSFYGMIKGIEDVLNRQKLSEILEKGKNITEQELTEILFKKARVEKIAIKDAKLRTFITEDKSRNDFVAHVYDITYGTVNANRDNLVVIDDSIVRGTTLKQSIIKILSRLNPKKIIIVSSAPQIRYPDCYGIDMAKIGDFIAFKAAIELLKEHGKENIIHEVYQNCLHQAKLPKEEAINAVKAIYEPFTDEEISKKISQLLKPEDLTCDLDIIYQKVEDLHKACPENLGDWYFTGNYPTPGGMKVVNKAFVNFYEGKNERAY